MSKELLDHGRKHRQTERERIWKRSEQQYEGKHWDQTENDDPTADLITINISFSTVNTIVPYVTGEEPNFLVEPYSGDASPRLARIQAALLNRVWRSSDTEGQNKLEDVAVDMLIYGDGFMQVGHVVEEQRLGDGETVDAVKVVLDRLDPWDVWIDPFSDGIHNARWVARRIITTMEELEDDDRYRIPEDFGAGVASEFYVGEEELRERLYVQGQGEDGNVQRWVVLYEFYDLVRGRMITFGDHEQPLRWIDEPALPIVQFGNYRIPRQPYHMGELEQLWDMQQELNKTRSQQITHRRRGAAKIAYLKDAITEEGKQALTSPEVMAGVPFEGGDLTLDQLIQPINIPNISSDAYNMSDIITRDVYEISGVNEYLRGATPEVRRTATEATIIEGASNVKSRHKLRLIEKGTRRVGQLMLDIMRDTFPQTEYDELGLYLTGSDAQAISRMEHGENVADLVQRGASESEIVGAEKAARSGVYSNVTVNPNDDLFKGRYEVFVESHSTELRNPMMKEQRAREMFLAVAGQAPMLQQMGVPVNVRKLLARWFEAAGIKDVDGMFEGGQNPMQQVQQMMMQQGGPAPTGQAPAGPGGDPTNILGAMGALTSENTGTQPVEDI